MKQVVKDRSATISVTFTVDGVATDPVPATATLDILRRDGTVLVPAGTATTKPPSTTGKFTFVLTPAQTAQFDRLTARWTANLVGQVQTLETQVDVIGPRELDARERLASMTAAGDKPVLIADDLARLIAMSRRSDADGISPLRPTWVETFDLNAAAAEGWRWKAGRVATSMSSRSVDGGYDADSFKYLNCIRQAEHYAKRATASVRVLGVGG